MANFHTPVLLKETIEALHIQKGKKYIDATVGGGGHTVEIVKLGGVVLGIDADEEAIGHTKSKIRNLTLVQGNFRDIDKIAHSHGFVDTAGILFDLGISSYQLDEEGRGFSFRFDAPLDMRMDRTLAVTAKDLINGLTKGELYELFTKLGEEKRALAVSDRIALARKIKPIETTGQLARLMIDVYRSRTKTHGIHPATRVFQALRIAVNDELNALREALPKAFSLLGIYGRLVVTVFHSLEDRIVKQQFRTWEAEGLVRMITKKPIGPTDDEVAQNPRARSAKMRCIEKIV